MKKVRYFRLALIVIIFGLTWPSCQKASTGAAEAPAEEESVPKAVTLTVEALKSANIRIEPAAFRVAGQTIKAVGEIEFNAKTYSHITSRSAGRIEEVFAFPGDRVKKGQVLHNFYSPDYLSLQAEFIQASERRRRLSADDAEQATAKALLDSVRRRLLVLGVGEEELAELEKIRIIQPLLSVWAPFSGSILESSAIVGDYVEFGVVLFKMADLSTLWAHTHIYEKDLPFVRPGCLVRVRVAALPGDEFPGRLLLVGDLVDEKTRTVEGRAEVPNPAGKLKPGMYIEADIVAPSDRRALFVPAAAVQDYENKKVVFVRSGEGTFSLREVSTGEAQNGFVEIRSGLKEGESVVTGGSFLLKSEMLKKSLGEDEP